MPAQRKPLVADKGATFTLAIRYKDSTGAPVNLIGHSVTFLMLQPGTETVIFNKVAGVTEDGWITIKATDEETALWTQGKKAYRVVHESPDGDKNWLVFGPLEVRRGSDV